MKKLFTIAVMAAATLCCHAQQALWGATEIKSPEINADHSVTFRLFAPNAASVKVTGDFLPTTKTQTPFGEADVPGNAALTKNSEGVWEYTSTPLSPELYSYTFLVDDLKINDPSNVYMVRDIASVTNIFLVGGDERVDLYAVNDVAHGTVAKVWYDSPTAGMKRRMTIYTPAGYEDSTESYPVFYLLHGMGGDENAWSELGRATQILDNLIAQGKAEPMIVVMTNGNISQEATPGETHYGFVTPTTQLPKTMEGSFEEAFPDVMKYVETHYRTKADKAHRAIAGLSMGGFHACHISAYYPDLFDYVGLFSAAIFPHGETSSPIYKDFDAQLARQFAHAPKLYWIAIGDKDFLYDVNKNYRATLDRQGYRYIYRESGDGHIWRNWRIYLSEFAPMLFK